MQGPAAGFLAPIFFASIGALAVGVGMSARGAVVTTLVTPFALRKVFQAHGGGV